MTETDGKKKLSDTIKMPPILKRLHKQIKTEAKAVQISHKVAVIYSDAERCLRGTVSNIALLNIMLNIKCNSHSTFLGVFCFKYLGNFLMESQQSCNRVAVPIHSELRTFIVRICENTPVSRHMEESA